MNNPAETPGRLNYLDWLRVAGMLGVFFFHNARFFDTIAGDWHVRNASTNLGASFVVAFLGQWIMPLFFLVAGGATYFALKSRPASEFARDRILRLLVPFIFGLLVIAVPQAYFQALNHGQPSGGHNLFQYYWSYVQTLPGGQTFHLWFLLDLFMISILALPLLLPDKTSGTSIISRLAKAIGKPWVLIPLLVLSLASVNILLYPAGSLGIRNGGFNLPAYILFFISGYLIFANPRIMEAVKNLRWLTLATGVVASVCLGVFFIDDITDPVAHFGTLSFAVAHFDQALGTWCWLLTILGFGSVFLNFSNKVLTYGNEAVLPFYLLHQTVIISIGFYVVQWNTGVGLKYLTISTASFIAIMLIYELMVRRINVLRFLFGMRSQKSISVASGASIATISRPE